MRLKCTIQYDGSNYAGYQIQPNAKTIQEEIESILTRMHKGKMIRIHSSGRTDRGVHAIGQVFHFDTDLSLPTENWLKALNAQLPDDIQVTEVIEVEADFHARIDAKMKEYRYFVEQADLPNIFKRHYVHFERNSLDMKKMEAACQWFIGTHDFTSFSSARSTVKGTKVRTLFDVRVERQADQFVFVLKGDGFLYNMVRIIVGVLLDAGKGKVNEAEVKEMFAAKNREFVGATLPPEGLFLWEVIYDENIKK